MTATRVVPGAEVLSNRRPDVSLDSAAAALPAKARDQIIAELNAEYAIVWLGDRPAVLHEGTGVDGLPEIRVLSIPGFQEWLRPKKVWVAEKEKSLPVTKIWLDSDRRRQFNGFTFDPTNSVAPGFYNLWKGFAVRPSSAGSCARFRSHVADNVCRGNPDLFAWVWGWFAAIVQRPAEKLGTSLVLRGPQGTGKTIVGETVGSLLRPHYQLASNERFLTGRFNAHLMNCLLLQLEEATWAGDHAAAGRLKDIVTGEYQMIEFKGKEPIRVPNYVRLLITSNNEWVVPAGLEERRFAVIDIGEEQIQNGPYFRAILDEMNSGGRERLLYELQTLDLADIPLRTIPATAALHEQKMASLSPELAWWLDIITCGMLPGDRDNVGLSPCFELYQHYLDRTQRRGVTRRGTETMLGVFLRRQVPGLLRGRKNILVGDALSRTYCYQFPPLADCRAIFDRSARTTTEWDTPITENESPEDYEARLMTEALWGGGAK